jgi:hypothetical protein
MSNVIDKSVNLLDRFSDNVENKIEILEENINFKKLKKHAKNFDNSLEFYNSLSLIMLFFLSGGLIGVLFILYYSFKNSD